MLFMPQGANGLTINEPKTVLRNPMVEKALSGVSESKREMRTVRIKRKVTGTS